MQCGRTSMIALDECASLSAFMQTHPEAAVLDFGGEELQKGEALQTVVIGCEGGFEESERKLFTDHPVRLLSVPMILRSETAVVAIAAALL